MQEVGTSGELRELSTYLEHSLCQGLLSSVEFENNPLAAFKITSAVGGFLLVLEKHQASSGEDGGKKTRGTRNTQ